MIDPSLLTVSVTILSLSIILACTTYVGAPPYGALLKNKGPEEEVSKNEIKSLL